MLITPVAESIWTVEQPFRFLGLQIGARMTVVRLATGGLWVHSPLSLDAALRQQFDALGPVRSIIAPSRFHSLCVNDFRSHYPEAGVYGSPDLAKRRSEISLAAVLGDEPEAEWAGEIEQLVVRGFRWWDEVVFFHRPSRTLIVADLVMSIRRDTNGLTRLFGRLTREKPGPPIELRLTLRDRAAARASLEKILAWDFDCIVLSHGHLVPTGGQAVLRQAYRFVLDWG